MKRFGPFGTLLALAALVIVLLLAARAWKSAMPAATQALKPGNSTAVPDHGDRQAGEAIRSGNLPDLKKMGQSTDAHIKQIQQAAGGQD